jgi:hypothetical protein
MDPIDSLQKMFDAWGGCDATYISSGKKNEGIKIFPNPVTNSLTVSREGVLNVARIRIVDLLGNRLLNAEWKNQKEITLNTSLLKPGIYFLVIENEAGERFASKIIKQ